MESEPMLTPREKSLLPQAQRRFEPATLHHERQRALLPTLHTTDWAIPAPFDRVDHGCTSWLSGLFHCCSVAWGCTVETDLGEAFSVAKVAFLCGPGVLELLPSFLWAVFSYFSSPDLRCWFRVLLNLMRSAARSSQDSVLISSAFMCLLQTSL